MTAKAATTTSDPPVAVIGAGSWGTALAQLLADKGLAVRLWVREPEVLEQISRGENTAFLPGVRLSLRLRPTLDLAEALSGAGLALMAVPSHVFRETLRKAAPLLTPATILASATKGLEIDTQLTMEGVVREELGAEVPYAVLSGPSFAREVAARQPTAVTVASRRPDTARLLQRLFSTSYFRVYTSYDVTGLELGGAVKNVFAIGAGLLAGVGLGDNPRAALITRGLAEITRLGMRLGANPMTLVGLGGLGDLILTCTSPLSRNYQVGLRLGRGESLEEILASMQMVAEGVKTSRAVYLLAQRLGVEMPIVEAVYHILYSGFSLKEAIRRLMARELKDELEAMVETW
jgi:glycerol-3-phosphate dehydrogenase (NAD(P)+)